MIKTILKTIVISIITVSIANAELLDLSGNERGIDVTLKSTKSLVVGENDLFVTLSKNETSINDAKVRIKFFMPEMPGMPYMEYKAKGKMIDGKYKMTINFSMAGTWQYKLEWKTSDDLVYKSRGSVNL